MNALSNPLFPVDNIVDGTGRNPELAGKGFSRCSRSVLMPYLFHDHPSQLSAAVTLSRGAGSAMAALGIHVSYILGLCPQEQMIGVYAGRIITPVQNTQSFWDIAIDRHPSCAVCTTHLTAPMILPIAVCIARTYKHTTIVKHMLDYIQFCFDGKVSITVIHCIFGIAATTESNDALVDRLTQPLIENHEAVSVFGNQNRRMRRPVRSILVARRIAAKSRDDRTAFHRAAAHLPALPPAAGVRQAGGDHLAEPHAMPVVDHAAGEGPRITGGEHEAGE